MLWTNRCTQHMREYGVVFTKQKRKKNWKRDNVDDNNNITAQTTLKASGFRCDLFVEIHYYMHKYISTSSREHETRCVTQCVSFRRAYIYLSRALCVGSLVCLCPSLNILSIHIFTSICVFWRQWMSLLLFVFFSLSPLTFVTINTIIFFCSFGNFHTDFEICAFTAQSSCAHSNSLNVSFCGEFWQFFCT